MRPAPPVLRPPHPARGGDEQTEGAEAEAQATQGVEAGQRRPARRRVRRRVVHALVHHVEDAGQHQQSCAYGRAAQPVPTHMTKMLKMRMPDIRIHRYRGLCRLPPLNDKRLGLGGGQGEEGGGEVSLFGEEGLEDEGAVGGLDVGGLEFAAADADGHVGVDVVEDGLPAVGGRAEQEADVGVAGGVERRRVLGETAREEEGGDVGSHVQGTDDGRGGSRGGQVSPKGKWA